MKPNPDQKKDKSNDSSVSNQAKRGESNNLPPGWLPRWLFRAIGPLSLVVLVVGTIAGFYAYCYITKESVRVDFWVRFMFSVLAFIILCVQVVIYAQQAQFMREQAEAMAESNKLARDALYVSNRPYVVVPKIKVNLPFEAGKVIVYQAIVENRGQTPAYELEFMMFIDIEPHLLPETPVFRLVRGRTSKVTLAQGTRMKGKQAAVNDILTQEQVDLIQNRKLFVYISGRVKYREAFTDQLHRTMFYVLYDPEEKRFIRGRHYNDAD